MIAASTRTSCPRRHRPAPMETRSAISRVLAAACAVIRFATFAQAISSTSTTSTPKGCERRTIVLLHRGDSRGRGVHFQHLFLAICFRLVECTNDRAEVAAYRRGALAEVVEDGVSGCLVAPDDIEQLTTAIVRCLALDRVGVRSSAQRRLHLEGMLDGYETALGEAVD